MQRVNRSIFILFLLGFFTVASAQLPPEMMADKYLIQAEQLHAAKDYAGAFKVMEQIITLQKEHNLWSYPALVEVEVSIIILCNRCLREGR